MKKNKYLFVCYMLLAIVVASGIFTRTYISLEERQKDGAKIHVVTSFYPIYIAALNVAQNSPDIVLDNLSEPQTGCLHDYQLTPQDMILLSKADLFLVNGNGIENFLADVGAAYPQLTISQASQGIELISTEEGFWREEHGDETHAHQEGNAHAWMDTRLYAQMVQKIADDLAGADPANQELYQENAQRYCEKVLDGEWGAFCLTEPNAGSDAGASKTTAVYDNGSYILNGKKCFITNGGVAGFYVVTAVTEKGKGVKGISAFVIDRGTPGLSSGAHEDKMGIRTSNTTDVNLENCRIPASCMLGSAGSLRPATGAVSGWC